MLQITLRRAGISDAEGQDIFIHLLKDGATKNPTVDGVRNQFLAVESLVQEFHNFNKAFPEAPSQSKLAERIRFYAATSKMFKLSPEEIQKRADAQRGFHPDYSTQKPRISDQRKLEDYVGKYVTQFHQKAMELGVHDLEVFKMAIRPYLRRWYASGSVATVQGNNSY